MVLIQSMGLRGNFSSGSLNRSGSGLFIMDRESEDNMEIGANVQTQLPGEAPSHFAVEGTPLNHEGYIKTSSMANFYYRRTSHGSLANASGDVVDTH